MSLLNKQNKYQPVHLCNVNVRVLGRHRGTAINLMIKEGTKFIQDNLIQVLSNRKYATEHLASIWQRATHEEGTNHEFLIGCDDPRNNKICFYLLEVNGVGIYRYSVVVTIDNMEKEIFEKFVEYIRSENGLTGQE